MSPLYILLLVDFLSLSGRSQSRMKRRPTYPPGVTRRSLFARDVSRRPLYAHGGTRRPGSGPGVTRRLANSPCPTPAIRNGAAKLKRRGMKIKYKCYSGFSLIGSKTARCEAGRWNPMEVPTCVSPGCLDLPEIPHSIVEEVELTPDGVSIPPGAMVRVSCLPGHHIHGDSLLWCDSILWNGTVPSCTPPSPQPNTTCDFEDIHLELCGWDQDSRDTMDWTITEGSTPTPGTGPSQAYQGHRYLLLESSAREWNSSATVFSPVFPSNLSVHSCFMFRFLMLGPDCDQLVVGQQGEDGQELQTLGVYSGNYGESWQEARVMVREVTSTWMLWITGRVGRSYLSDIGLDTMELVVGDRCEEPYTEPTPHLSKERSPASCWDRCEINVTQDFGWTEGSCSCIPSCFLGLGTVCCSDYTVLCGITNKESRMEEVPVIHMSLVLVGLVGVMVLTVVLVLVVRRRRWRMEEEGEEAEGMLEDEEWEARTRVMGEARVVVGPMLVVGGDCGEFIDFTLATQCPDTSPLAGHTSLVCAKTTSI